MENQKTMRNRAQYLRKNMTKEEKILWYQFLKTYPVPFKRQYQIGNYIVDFYCYQAKMVVELDGSQHYDAKAIEYDKRRTSYISGEGMLVIRIPNNEIDQNFRAVCDHIDQTVQERLQKKSLF